MKFRNRPVGNPIAEVTIKNGSKDVAISIFGGKEWIKEEHRRIYYDVESNNKRRPLSSLCQILDGAPKYLRFNEWLIEVDGKEWIVGTGVDANSKVKREALEGGVMSLIAQINKQIET